MRVLEPTDMSRRTIVVLSLLAALALAIGIAGGLLMARDRDAGPAAAEAPVEPEPTAAPDSSEPASSSGSTTSSSTSSTSSPAASAGLVVQARVAQRLEDGLLIGWDASAPIAATLTWGFGAPDGNRVAIPGTARQGMVKLSLNATTRTVTFRVTGRAADGRTGASRPASGRRLVRRVTVRVTSLTLDIPDGTGGVTTTFLGASVTPLGPGVAGPTASAEPYAFPATAVAAGDTAANLTVQLAHQVPPGPPRTGTAQVPVDFPQPGRSTTFTRDATRVGVTAHLTLRVTVSLS